MAVTLCVLTCERRLNILEIIRGLVSLCLYHTPYEIIAIQTNSNILCFEFFDIDEFNIPFHVCNLIIINSCFNSFFFILFFFLSMTFHQTASILQYDHTLHIIISPMLIYILLHRLIYLFFLCYSFQDALSSRKAFVRYISHEVRTPLNIGKNNPDHYLSIFLPFNHFLKVRVDQFS